MWLQAIKDQQVAGFQFHLNELKTRGIWFVMIAVFGLGEFPGIIGPVQFRDALKAAHVFIRLIGQGQDTLHILGFCFGIVVPVNKSFVFKSGS